MKVFKVKDYIESYYRVYNIVVANTKEEALKVIKEKAFFDESYFTLEDIEEIPDMEYNGNCPKLILSIGENVRE